MACGNGNRGAGAGAGGMFIPPNFAQGFDASGFNPFGPNPFTSETAAAGLRGLMAQAAPFLQNIVGHIDQNMVEEAIRMSMGGTTTAAAAAQPGNNQQQFRETVKVEKSGDTEKHRVDINLGVDAKADSLKISRKDHVMTINVKTEKSAEDGSSRLYQEYTKKITLPENVDLSQLESTLSPEGVLTIQAPFLPKAPVESKSPGTQIPVIIEDDRID